MHTCIVYAIPIILSKSRFAAVYAYRLSALISELKGTALTKLLLKRNNAK